MWIFNLSLVILGVLFVIGMDGVMIPRLFKKEAQTDPYTWVIFVILCSIGVFLPIQQGLRPVDIVVPICMLILDIAVMIVAFMTCYTKPTAFNKWGIGFAAIVVVSYIIWNMFVGKVFFPHQAAQVAIIGNYALIIASTLVAIVSTTMRIRAIKAGNREVPLGIILMALQYLLVIMALPWFSGSGPLPPSLYPTELPLIDRSGLEIFFIVGSSVAGFTMNTITLCAVIYYNKKRDVYEAN
jgi:hypothetical membrane protein